MNCNNCGFELQTNTKFCDNCGTKVEGQAPAPVQSAQPTYGQAPAPVQSTQPTYGQAPAPVQSTQPTYGQAPAPAQSTQPPYGQAPAPSQSTQPTYGQAPAPVQSAQPTYGQAPAPVQGTQPTYGQAPAQNPGSFNSAPPTAQYNAPPMGMNTNNYYAGTQTAVAPKKPNPLIFVAIGAFAVIVLSVLLFVFILPSLNSSDENSEYLGVWNAKEYVMAGASIPPEDMGMTMTLELKSGNNCTIDLNGEEYNVDWRYEDGVFALIDGSDEFTGSINGNNLSLTNILNLGFDVVFAKEGTSGSVEVTPPVAQSNATGSESTLQGGTSAPSSTPPLPVTTGPLAVTQTLETGVYWYGTMTISNYSGSIERLEVRDVWGELMTENSTGLTFFQFFDTSDFSSATAIFSAYCTISDTQLFSTSYTDGDAWIFQKNLTNNEMVYFSPTLNQGVLEFNYYYNYNGESFDVNIYLREDGKAWDENIDILPPSYDTYKQAIGGVSLSD